MVKVWEGNLDGQGTKIGIVAGRFNQFITSQLLEGALDACRRHGITESDVEVAWVPGAYEIPLMAQKMAGTGRFDAVVCLGVVIRGATPHFDYVAGEVAKGVAQVSMRSGLPITFGVLTTETIEQAIERAGTKSGNKGWDAVVTAIEMVNLIRQFS